jgi:hypothetical protein
VDRHLAAEHHQGKGRAPRFDSRFCVISRNR